MEDDDGERTDDDDEGDGDSTPRSKRRKPANYPVSSVMGNGREEGQQCMHALWGKCTLLAAADGGWNCQCASDNTNFPSDKSSWYAHEDELTSC